MRGPRRKGRGPFFMLFGGLFRNPDGRGQMFHFRLSGAAATTIP